MSRLGIKAAFSKGATVYKQECPVNILPGSSVKNHFEFSAIVDATHKLWKEQG